MDFIKANPYSVIESSVEFSKNYETGVVSESNSNILISYQSMDDATGMINSYDPITDQCLKSKQGKLIPDMEISLGFGQGILRNIEE